EARFERECACDDAVLSHGLRASDYAGQLIALARSLNAAPDTAFGAIAVARTSELEHRVRAILETRTNRSTRSRVSLLLTAGLLAAMLPIAVVRLDARHALPPAAAAGVSLADGSAPATDMATPARVPAAPRQVATQQPPSSTSQVTWPQERLQMLMRLYGLGNKFYSDAMKMVE